MLVLGLAGGIAAQNEADPFELGKVLFHDAAAALVCDGVVLAAIEEERVNRIKHTNKAPLNAINACLETAGVALQDVDAFAYYADDGALTAALRPRVAQRVDRPFRFRDALIDALERGLKHRIEPGRIHFVPHHWAHAMSAYAVSGFNRSLIFTIDAMGEEQSGMVFDGKGRSIEPLRSFTIQNSLGFLYADLIQLIGFEYQEEYKVMGLAPYGSPDRYRAAFEELYELLPGGDYRLRRERFAHLRSKVRRRGRLDPINQEHKDFAASLQQTLERIVFHVLTDFQASTAHRSLCLAGGVAQNCSMNGKLIESGMFEQIFVQPASTDAGCALGAALYVHGAMAPGQAIQPIRHVYLGRDLGEESEIARTLEAWKDFIHVRKMDDVCGETADLLAAGQIVGWVQGRSEFGPRALGNRSILADPRPVSNRERINAAVKKREAFRPLAPAVLEEASSSYFELPDGLPASPYMTFVVKVRPDKRGVLGAVTHVDGTARVQTVRRQTNERFWRLLRCFGDKTGVPVLINTSFNNDCEPMVDSVHDAIVCLLTSDLDCAIVDRWLIVPKEVGPQAYFDLTAALPGHLRLETGSIAGDAYWIASNVERLHRVPVSIETGRLLETCIGSGETMRSAAYTYDCSAQSVLRIAHELHELWDRRLLRLVPKGVAPR